MHKFLKAHGVLTGEFVEKNALELKGEYVGSTTPLVKACFAEAKGGTLFLDEAYGLSADGFKNGGDSFSKEAVRTLLSLGAEVNAIDRWEETALDGATRGGHATGARRREAPPRAPRQRRQGGRKARAYAQRRHVSGILHVHGSAMKL